MRINERRQRAIICEDNANNYQKLASYLQAHGFEVARARTEQELRSALQKAHRTRSWFDLVMLDLDLSLSGETQSGADIYFRLSYDFPHESYVVYTTQEVETFRRTINELSLRRVQVALLDHELNRRSIESGLNRAVEHVDPKRVFLVHGRNHSKKRQIETLLTKGFGLTVVSWEMAREEVREPLRDYIFEIVIKGIESSHATVVLFTDDENARLRKELQGGGNRSLANAMRLQSRVNVYLEAGYALAIRPGRTVFIEWPRPGKSLNQPSDLEGIHVIRFDGSRSSRTVLKERLEAARCSLAPSRNWQSIPI